MAAALAGASGASANSVTPFTTVFNADVAQFGFGGLRDNGTGTMEVTGITGPATQAFLYWHGPTNSDDPAANGVVSFGGQDVTGTNIGVGNDNCWAYANSQAYRADVTSIVTGNGSYALANFVKNNNSVNANGASLVVFYDDGDPANDKDVALFDGNDSNEAFQDDPAGWDVNLPGIQYASGAGSMVLHVTDGQSFPDPSIIVNGTTVLPSGANFDGDTVPGNPAGNRNGLLWDVRSFDVTSFLTPGPNTLHMTTGPNVSDCIALVLAEVILPAGSAPAEAQVSTGDDVRVNEGNDGTTPMTFTITRQDIEQPPAQVPAFRAASAAVSKKVTVKVSTDGGTATPGEDYVAKSETLTFAPGETSKTFTVDVKGDTTPEGDETVGIRLAGAVGGRIAKAVATGTIVNDDAAPVTVPITEVVTGAGSPKKCVSRRNFTIRLRTKRLKVKHATVTVDGKRVAVRRGKRLTAPIDLRLKPRKTVVVRITVTLADGKVLTGKRVYHTCIGKRPGGKPRL
jgi:hypothetical protein